MSFRHHKPISLWPRRLRRINAQCMTTIQSRQNVGCRQITARMPKLCVMGHRHRAQSNPVRSLAQPGCPLFGAVWFLKSDFSTHSLLVSTPITIPPYIAEYSSSPVLFRWCIIMRETLFLPFKSLDASTGIVVAPPQPGSCARSSIHAHSPEFPRE
jgi:hypothetical protein